MNELAQAIRALERMRDTDGTLSLDRDQATYLQRLIGNGQYHSESYHHRESGGAILDNELVFANRVFRGYEDEFERR
jgi:hypothetical protein